MTDEERQKLCENLRSIEAEHPDELIERLHEAGLRAADEIERLEKELKEERCKPTKFSARARLGKGAKLL